MVLTIKFQASIPITSPTVPSKAIPGLLPLVSSKYGFFDFLSACVLEPLLVIYPLAVYLSFQYVDDIYVVYTLQDLGHQHCQACGLQVACIQTLVLQV